MKFIHVSDIHIGTTPDPMMPWSESRSLDIKDSFANVINKCKEEKADFLLISGDLFNHQPTTQELNQVNELFASIYDTKVMIVAGSSDHIKANSPVLNYKFSDNVYYFLNQYPEEVDINGTLITIHGFSYLGPEIKSSILNQLSIPNDKRIHILLAYGGTTRHCPIDFDLLSKMNVAYVALGSKHSHEVVVNDKIAYAGSLEPLSIDESGSHGIYIGEINKSTRRVSSLEFVPMAKLSYIPLKLKINATISEDDLITMVNDEIGKNGINNIYKIELNGYRNPEIDFAKNIFSDNIKIVDFVDNTEPKYDFVKLSKDHPQDMIGTYIRSFLEKGKALSDIEKNALFEGVSALMKTSDGKEG